MKTLFCSVVGAVTLAAAVPQANAEPLARLSFRSYADLTNAIGRFAATLDPQSQTDHGVEFSRSLGLTNAATFDAKRPWEVAVWYSGMGSQPLIAIKAPAADIAKFKEGLGSEGPLRAQGKEWAQLGGGVGLITFRAADSLNEEEQSALREWKAEAIRPPTHTLELTLSMGEPVRNQVLGLLAMGKMSIGQAMSAQKMPSPVMNPAALGEMLNLYFDILHTVISGFQQFKLGLQLEADALIVEKHVRAKAGTDLAKWLERPAGRVTSQELARLDPEASASVAAYFGKEPLQFLKKATMVGFQMQNVATNDPVVKEVEGLLEKFLPAAFVGSVYFKDKFAFVGAYRFPQADVAQLYSQLKQTLNHGLQSLVGKDKVYSSIAVLEKNRTLNGLPIDRFALTLNPDGPLFKLPGQKEQLQAFYPDGKMEIDYTIKDGQMLAATPDRMKDLLASSGATPASTLKLEEGTCVAGYLNFLGLVKQLVGVNPMVPAPVKAKLAKLEPQGTAVEFQLSLDQQAHSVGRVPLKLFRELGRLKGD